MNHKLYVLGTNASQYIILIIIMPTFQQQQQQQRGKTILRALLILSAICVFAYLYSLIREPFSNKRHAYLDINQVHFVFTCLLLLLIGMPIIR